MPSKKASSLILFSIVITLGLSISAQSLIAAAWIPPSANPPTNNLSEFINASTVAQGKLGYFGIGTSAPNRYLHILKNDSNNAEIDIQSVAGANNHWAIYHDNVTADLKFWNNTPAGEKNILTLTNEGNVGVGTTNPWQKLDVVGTVKMTGFQLGNSATAGNVLTADASGNGTWQSAGGGVGGSGLANRLPKWSSTSTLTNSTIYDNGLNVGVGTTTPICTLHVIGDVKTDRMFLGTTLQTGILNIKNSGSLFWQTMQATDATGRFIGFFNSAGGSAGTERATIGYTAFDDIFSIGNNANKYQVVLNQTGNFGIGIRNPTYTLHVNGNAYATSLYTNAFRLGAATTAGYVLTADASGNGTWQAAGGSGLPAGTSGQTLRHDGTTWVANSNLYNNGTNVGIGTTSPTTKLSIASTNSNIKIGEGMYGVTDSGMYVKSNNGIAGFFAESPVGSNPGMALFQTVGGVSTRRGIYTYVNSRNNIELWSESGIGMGFLAGGAAGPQVQITAGGNVGIGDVSPASLLSVGNGDLFQVNSSGNIVKVNNITYSWPAAQGAASTVLTNNGAGTLTWAAAGGGLPAGTSGQTLRHDGTNWMANSNLFNNGTNVGIGTTNPLDRLHIDAGSSGRPMIQFSGGGVSNSWIIGRATSENTFSIAETNIDTRLVIKGGTGNVGIGTTDPVLKFVVKGGNTALYGNADGVAGQIIQFEPSTTAAGGTSKIYSIYNAGASEGPLALGTYSNQQALFIKPGGNVGIGTTNPAANLDILTQGSQNLYGSRIIAPDNHQLNIFPSTCAGCYSQLVGAGDTHILFTAGAQDTGNLVISPWSANEKGVVIRGGTGATMSVYDTSGTTGGLYVKGNTDATSNYWGIKSVIGSGEPVYQSVAVYGANNSGRQGSIGVVGTSNSPTGFGVYAYNAFADGYGLYCNGAKCGGSVAWQPASDIRLKKNIVTLTNALDKVLKLRGVNFELKQFPGVKRMGFIAQEVEPVVPELVSKDNNGYYSISESSVTALIVEAMKDQQKQINDLKAEIQKLKQN